MTRNRRSSSAGTWRLILATGACALGVLGATSVTLRAFAQAVPAPAPATAPAASAPAPSGQPASVPKEATKGDDPATAEPDAPQRAATPRLSSEDAPEFRESADNNISLPVDI
jgi:hypothetical protein